MTKRRRWLQVTKWAAWVLCVPMLAVYAASGWFCLIWYPNERLMVQLGRGRLGLISWPDIPIDRVSWYRTALIANSDYGGDAYGIYLREKPIPRFDYAFENWTAYTTEGRSQRLYVRHSIPLWLFAAPAVLLTAVLWWLDRRRCPAGHCAQCGYNLTGNTSGRCPECGLVVAISE